MFTILLRVIIIYLIVLALVRLMGKRQIGELQPFELVIMLIFADIATIPMTDSTVPLLIGIIPLIALVLLQFFLSLLSRKSLFFQKLINGKPVIVIGPNGIIYQNLKALNMSLDDLQEALRGCNVSNFDEVQYAIIETNGKMSVIIKSENKPATNKDLKIVTEESTYPIILIDDGRLNKENLQLANVGINFIQQILKKYNIPSYKKVLIMSIDNNGKIYLQTKTGKSQTLYVDFDGGKGW